MPDDPLTEDEVRRLLRECVTVVKPGEVLVIRAWETWTVPQMRALQDVLNDMHKVGAVPFRSLVVPGAELGVAEPGETVVRHEVAPLTDAQFADQLHRVMQLDRRVNPGARFLP